MSRNAIDKNAIDRSASGKLPLAAALALVLSAAPAMAEVIMFKGDLTGGAETPPSGSKATGEIEVKLDPASKKITWKGHYKGLRSEETQAHFHGPAGPGQNAPPVLPVDATGGKFEGQATLDAQQVKQLESGKWYFNVHTDKHPEGALRGQLTRVR
ncbi:CHRD domain-containing protein [Methylosinus sp. Sm6]|uniref:CHRD domain-containing protein n=1 Tax=Methylosinus sp. Sm6 TaxID=2866948 RepID=UPI001C999848|nr:CHRD domain-containing protein [Methylosinus sp. Sm6]MBY6242140.1 CHRD domain-containing protein [Methylosinus sp. Sm6]